MFEFLFLIVETFLHTVNLCMASIIRGTNLEFIERHKILAKNMSFIHELTLSLQNCKSFASKLAFMKLQQLLKYFVFIEL